MRWVQIVIADDDTAHLAQVWDEHYTEADREYHGGVWSRKIVSEEEARDLLIDLDSEVVEWTSELPKEVLKDFFKTETVLKRVEEPQREYRPEDEDGPDSFSPDKYGALEAWE